MTQTSKEVEASLNESISTVNPSPTYDFRLSQSHFRHNTAEVQVRRPTIIPHGPMLMKSFSIVIIVGKQLTVRPTEYQALRTPFFIIVKFRTEASRVKIENLTFNISNFNAFIFSSNSADYIFLKLPQHLF